MKGSQTAPYHGWQGVGSRLTEASRVQVVRVFGKFPALRRMVAALTACVVPMLSAFSILVIIIAICAGPLKSPLHPPFLTFCPYPTIRPFRPLYLSTDFF